MAKVVNITMPEELFKAIEQQAKTEDRPRSSLFREAIRIYLGLKRKEVERQNFASLHSPRRFQRGKNRAERILDENVIALNKIAMAKGITEEDLLRIGKEIRRELFEERYGRF